MNQFEIRRLGRTEMRAAAIGLGGASLGSHHRSDEEAIAAVRRAIELGMNYIDTSPLYGESERRVGLALHFCLAVPLDGILIVGSGTPEHVEEVCREAQTPVPPEVWRDFKAEFGVGL
jgi:aryl-alcohol dehydrogenase-like predicted oxidoreductase